MPAARAVLESNLAHLELEDCSKVWPLLLPSGLKRVVMALGQADLVFMDPPYGGGPAQATLAGLGERGTLRFGARVVVEHHAKDILPEQSGSLLRTRERQYGETCLSFYRTQPDAPSG